MQKRKFNLAKLKFGVLVLFVLVLIAVYLITAIRGYGFFEGIKEFVKTNPKLSPIIFTSLYVISAFFPLPLLTIFGSTLFSFWEVLIYSLIGNIVNATIIFYLARWLGRDFVKHFEAKHKLAKKLDMTFKKHAIRDMVLVRFFYPLPIEVGNLAGGLSGIKYRDYLWGILIGMTPVIIASILAVQGQMAGNNLMMTIATIMFVLMIAIPIFYISGLRKYTKEKFNDFVGLRR